MNNTFHEPKQLAFIPDDTSTPLSSVRAIVGPTHNVLEPNLSFSNGIFNGWFSISFQDTLFDLHIYVYFILPKC